MKKYFRNIILVLFLTIIILPIKANAATKTNFHLEKPTNNQSEYKEMVIAGWLMTESNDPKIHMYIDNKEITPTVNRYAREDVVKSNPGYSKNTNNKQPGFNTKISTTNYSNGKHILTINVLDYEKNEVLSQYSTTFYVEKSKTVLHLEHPTSNKRIKKDLTVSGWLVSTNKDAIIEYYLNKTKIEKADIRSARPDVLKSMPGYGGIETNPTPGFKLNLDMSNYTEGNYFLEVIIKDKETGEILTGDSRNITLSKYDSKINIDHPKENEEIGTSLTIDGWTLCEYKDYKLEIYLDNNLMNNEIKRTAREDVLKAMNYGFGGRNTNPTPGFSTTIDTSEINDGVHTITLKIVNKTTNEVIGKQTRKINIDKNKTVINIDHPVGTQKNNIRIDGWYLSANANANIKVLIDNKEINTSITRTAREDVLKAMNYGYGGKKTNPKPGFSLILDSKNYLDGEHTVTIRIVDANNKVLREESRKYTLKKYDSLINVDHPEKNVKEDIVLDGWYLSECKDNDIEVYVDSNKIESTITRTARPDVLKAKNNGYGGINTNPKPGFSMRIDLRNYKDGDHQIVFKIIDKNTKEVIGTNTRNIKLKKYEAFINIDSPKVNELKNRNASISGWSLSTDLNDRVEVLVDNNLINANITRTAREDVIKAMNNGYGGKEKNPTPGINTTIDLSSYKDGKHTLTIRVVDTKTNDVISEAKREFKLKKYDGKLHLENPTTSMFNGDTMVIAGWEMSELDNSYIEIYIDNNKIDTNISRFERQDVIEGVSGYGTIVENATPGFNTTINISNISKSKHTLKLVLKSKLNEPLTEISKDIIIYKGVYLGIDVSTFNGNINWGAVKNDGISFALIRAGYRGYTVGGIVEDDKFKYNITNAVANNISSGVYFYTQAINENEAISEADFTVGKLQEYGMLEKLKLPIVIDTEFTDYHIGRADGLSQAQRTKVVKAFCNRIRQHGYTPMIYASRDFLYFNLHMSELSSYDVWLAHYTSNDDPLHHPSNYTGAYKIWQYTSSGTVSGINGRVDKNISYVKY